MFAADGARFAKAIAAAVPAGTEVLTGDRFAALEATPATAAVDAAHAAVGPDTIAKFLLTSGSTGQPKAVINTQRMLCSNQQMLTHALPSLRETPPVLVDWLPWNHTAGSNHNLGLVLNHGGTLYIDEGKPRARPDREDGAQPARGGAHHLFQRAARLRGAAAVPARRRANCARRFFSRLGLLQYAAAVLPQPIWQAYEELAVQTCGERILWITGYGATETAPAAMFTSRGAARAGTVGLPVDGVEMKLVPAGEKLEARFRGPSVTPGYWRQPELTRAAFDEEGFYRTGDAMRFVDRGRSAPGLRVRRPHHRGFQARHRHLGERGPAAREDQFGMLASGAGRGHHRPRPRLAGRAGIPERRRLPRTAGRRDPRAVWSGSSSSSRATPPAARPGSSAP